mmetsp:Transcript_573/g.1462  ORF Transcript_573/g.1462 Transcript_573/m.1462 type:complete len:227 (-) Transcript_573:371-1051(-)
MSLLLALRRLVATPVGGRDAPLLALAGELLFGHQLPDQDLLQQLQRSAPVRGFRIWQADVRVNLLQLLLVVVEEALVLSHRVEDRLGAAHAAGGEAPGLPSVHPLREQQLVDQILALLLEEVAAGGAGGGGEGDAAVLALGPEFARRKAAPDADLLPKLSDVVPLHASLLREPRGLVPLVDLLLLGLLDAPELLEDVARRQRAERLDGDALGLIHLLVHIDAHVNS